MSDPAAPPPEVGATLLPLRIVHAAIASTVLVYAAMLSLLTRRPPDSTVAREAPPAGLTWMLGAIAAIVLVAAVLVRRRAGARAQRRLAEAPPPPARGGHGRAGNPAAPYFTTCLLSWAIAEVVAVLGLVLGFLHWQLTPFLPFGAISLAALLYLAPRRGELESILAGAPRG